ncbi:MAG: TerC family protein [Deltaproteobacteria bacterium]|nr:TerC family protein [Deltaproteobacteria bacterium]
MLDLSILFEPQSLVSLVTLTAMEVVLGVDNVVFISILTAKLSEKDQPRARSLGLSLALILRIALLFSITWVMRLKTDLFSVLGHGFSGRDLILLGGGLFLIGKSTHEIFDKLEVQHHEEAALVKRPSFGAILAQVLVLDIVFSLDSVITAVGMARHISIMVIATIVAAVVMIVFAGAIGNFVNRHPSMKILALSFLLLIGVMLVAEGMGQHVNKGYIYFAMAFSLGVELINMQVRRRQRPIKLHHRFEEEEGKAGGQATQC